jgi:hypothetical protein
MSIRSTITFVLLQFIFTIGFAQDEPAVFGDYYHSICVGVGGFSPSTGKGGITFFGGYYRQTSPRLLIGGEISYTEFKSRIFIYDNVEFSTINITSTVKYVFPMDNVQPHIGGYIDFGFHSIDQSNMPGITLKNSVAGSYGLGILTGITVNVNENILFSFEGRYGGDWVNTELQGYMKETRNYGGFTITGGLLFLF